jgi:hypothetical protein
MNSKPIATMVISHPIGLGRDRDEDDSAVR